MAKRYPKQFRVFFFKKINEKLEKMAHKRKVDSTGRNDPLEALQVLALLRIVRDAEKRNRDGEHEKEHPLLQKVRRLRQRIAEVESKILR